MAAMAAPPTRRNRAVNGLRTLLLSPKIAFMLVSFSLGELGDGLNIFQGVYLVSLGWNEGSVGLALSLMGLTSLFVQPWAGDLVDKTTIDRRIFLTIASIVTALSASAIIFVRPGNNDHALIFSTKIIEGVASSFIAPCLAALTLATFGPHHFDRMMANNIFYGHLGTVGASVIAGTVAFILYPKIKFCFLVIGIAALVALLIIPFLPQGDPLMGRGFQGKVAMDEFGQIEQLESDESTVAVQNKSRDKAPKALPYWEVFSDVKTGIVCATGFFFHFANANVLLVLGELMSNTENKDGSIKRSAIPLIAGAIVLAQITMAVATYAADKLTFCGVGRKPLFLAGLASLPIRCALVILWKDKGDAWLLSTQILDGLGGGLCGLMHPYVVADITFGSGRFNVVSESN
jgi:MFS family permease